MKVAFALLLSALVLGGCGEKDAPASRAEAPRAIEVVPVKSELLWTKAPLPAQLLPYESVDLYPKIAGFVQDVLVDRGSEVRKGQLLVRLTAPEVVAQRAQTVAALGAAQAKLTGDRATYERLANAAKTPGVVAENDVDIARQTTASDAALVRSAAETAVAARQLGAYLEIRAPFDGVITTRNLQPGALVGPGQTGALPILQLVTEKRLRLVVAVPEDSVQAAKPGLTIAFTVSTAPGRTFDAPIARMAEDMNNRTRTMMVEADVDNASGDLTPGTLASVQWPIQRSYPTLRVPTSAVANDQERQFVIRVSNGTTAWVDVSTGMTVEGDVEVFGKLNPGDLVVRQATDALRAGVKIRTVDVK